VHSSGRPPFLSPDALSRWNLEIEPSQLTQLHKSGIKEAADGTASPIRRSPYMSLRADRYRQRAAEAKDRAAQASEPSIKRAFQDVAAGWIVLAEQAEWMDSEKPPLGDEEK
jgi:hypothetical protein